VRRGWLESIPVVCVVDHGFSLLESKGMKFMPLPFMSMPATRQQQCLALFDQVFQRLDFACR